MIDSLSSKMISTLHPKLRAEVTELMDKVYLGGINIKIVQALRTFKEQDALYAQGRTQPGKIVTNAKAGLSYHNYGLALDFCMFHKDGTSSWSLHEDMDQDGKEDWMEVVNIFKSKGYSWGGDFKSFQDNPHFEKSFGLSVRECLDLKTSKTDPQGYILI